MITALIVVVAFAAGVAVDHYLGAKILTAVNADIAAIKADIVALKAKL